MIWGGGIKAAELAGASGLAQGARRPRRASLPDLTVDGAPGVYAVGDVANIPGPHGDALPQLGSVALQSGTWAADNVLADFAGKPRKPFHYHDKGIMAMIGTRRRDRRGRRAPPRAARRDRALGLARRARER